MVGCRRMKRLWLGSKVVVVKNERCVELSRSKI